MQEFNLMSNKFHGEQMHLNEVLARLHRMTKYEHFQLS